LQNKRQEWRKATLEKIKKLKMKTKLNTVRKREIAVSLVNSYEEHCNETGLSKWKQSTPQYVKDLQKELFRTYEYFNKHINP